jgi:cytochrome oxidase Cu insertion factor (SCO1/SenC/PrrC family)
MAGAAAMASTLVMLMSACASDASEPEASASVAVLPSAGGAAPTDAPSSADPHQSAPPSDAQTYEEVRVSDEMTLVRPLLWNYEGFRVEPEVAAPSILLTDQDGERVNLRDVTRGAYTLLAFGYTSCPDICPGTQAVNAAALRELPAAVRDEIRVVWVSVDPERDTLPVIDTWLANFDRGLDSDFIGLRPNDDGVAHHVQWLMHVNPATKEETGHDDYAMSHAAYQLLFFPDGKARLAYPFGMTADQFRADLTALVEDGWDPAV